MMINTKSALLLDFLALFFGAVLTFSFAPFSLWPLAVLSPAVLLICWINVTPKRSFWRGWLFGIGFFATSVYWIFISLHSFGGADTWFAALATAAVIMVLALYIALSGYLFNRLFTRNTLIKVVLVFPALWVLFEWCRTWLFTGFPWVLLGYSQTHSPLRGLAPLLSVYGVSWAVCITSATIVSFFIVKKKRWLITGIILLVILWVSSSLLTIVKWSTPDGPPVKVSLIQGNIPQSVKWQPQQSVKTLRIYANLTQQYLTSDIIIWPEAAVPFTQHQARPFLNNMTTLAKQHHSTIITGIPIMKGDRYYNGMLALGNSNSMYLKRHLVPFGEYLPLRSVFDFFGRYVQIPMSDLSAGPFKQPDFIVNGIKLAPYICYEIAYPEEVRKTLQHAKAIVVITDDSWFGHSIASSQHLQIAQMRSLETDRPLLMSTNNGITAFIKANGDIKQQIVAYKRLALTNSFIPRTGNTPWMLYGLWPMSALVVLSLLLGLLIF